MAEVGDLPERPIEQEKLPVTLLSGFLGSGKTSLMKHILQNKEGLRVAIIMNEITEVNLDVALLEGAKLVKSEEKVVEMANGCICCTLREDLLLQLRELARSGKYDAVLVESSGIAEPMQVAETFMVQLGDGNPMLQKEAPLDNCVTVIDASVVDEHMLSLKSIDTLDETVDTSAESSQDIAMLLFQQLEFANVVLLNKTDLLMPKANEADREKRVNELKAIIGRINPRAEVLVSEYSRVDLKKILATGNFGLDFLQGFANWMDDIKTGVKHVPETLEYGVSGFYWSSKRAFHPKRLHDWMDSHFLLKEQYNEEPAADETQAEEEADAQAAKSEEPEELSDEEVEAQFQKAMGERNARRKDKYGNLFRSKGFVWVGGAERQRHVVEWGQAGTILMFQPLALREDAEMDADIDGAQRLTFVGQHLNREALEADLEAMLMTAEEAEQLEKDIAAGKLDTLEDPFQPFPKNYDHEHDDEHDHHHH